MSFLYFVDGKPRLKKEEIHALGLAYAFPDGAVSVGCDGSGPNRTQGSVLAPDSFPIGFVPDRQIWARIPPSLLADAAPPIHVGYWNDKKPGPQDLKLPEQLRGTEVVLRDGNPWVIPVARKWQDNGPDDSHWTRMLPGPAEMHDDGKWYRAREPDTKYKKLWDSAQSFWEELNFRFLSGAIEQSTVQTFSFDGASAALSANYRIGEFEVSMLGLLDDQGVFAGKIASALVEWPVYLEWLKKNLTNVTLPSVGLPIASGQAAETSATNQPS